MSDSSSLTLRGLCCDTRWPKGKRQMRDWRIFVRPIIMKTPKKVLHAIWKSIPRRRVRIIEANGGAISY